MYLGANELAALRSPCCGWLGAVALALAACTAPPPSPVGVGTAPVDSLPSDGDADTQSAAPDDAQDAAAPAICASCVSSEDCGSDQHCAQVGGSAYCLTACGAGGTCASDSSCATVADAAGNQVQVCIPSVAPCGALDRTGEDDAATAAADGLDASPELDTTEPDPTEPDTAAPDTAGQDGSPTSTCPGFADPTTPACCTCSSGKSCSPNGCYNGWLCNLASCKCNPPPDTCSGGSPDAGSSPDVPDPVDTSTADTGEPVPPDQVDNGGGTLANLDFAIVGDTRPPVPNVVSLYPTAIITKIWQGVPAEQPPLPFAITTGDYVFSTKNSSTAAPQFDLYLGARAKYAGKVFYALGNHECTGATASNCGPGNKDGETALFNTFKSKLLAPIGKVLPYYSLKFKATSGKWTAKFVVVAANAWDADQAAWLEQALAEPTTYTFVVRHESDQATEAPGVLPSAAIMAKYPYTLLIAGHTHTYAYYPSKREIVLGTGGAPLATAINYSYGVVRQKPNMLLEVNVYDYTTHAVLGHFVVAANGTPQP
ncbi:MAG: metallophosphoesterase [Deltaproteobacteria bacterium]|nr:metallophosphoesterase [Deltaproteobacteria bacterium]